MDTLITIEKQTGKLKYVCKCGTADLGHATHATKILNSYLFEIYKNKKCYSLKTAFEQEKTRSSHFTALPLEERNLIRKFYLTTNLKKIS